MNFRHFRSENQLTGFHMRTILAFKVLDEQSFYPTASLAAPSHNITVFPPIRKIFGITNHLECVGVWGDGWMMKV